MIRPTRLATGAFVAVFGILACSDNSPLTGPDRSPALRPNQSVASATSAESGPMTSQTGANVCADVNGAGRGAGTRLIAWGCNGGANQQFAWQPTGEVKVYGSMCVDAANAKGRDGDAIIIWSCNGGANQKWRYTDAHEIRGINDKCVAISDARPANQAQLVLRACDGTASQKWNVRTTTASPTAAPTTPSPSQSSTGSGGQVVPADTSSPTTTHTPGAGVAAPELPRTYLSSAVVAPTGTTTNVRAGGDLQAALDAAKPGDVLLLEAGATFSGNFILPSKAGSGWITIRTSASDASLPAPGTRITPRYAGALPKIVSPNVTNALATAPGAHHYRLIGVEVTSASNTGQSYGLVGLGDVGSTQTSLSQVPHDLVLDRVYVHGSASLDVRRCVALNSASTAIVDSWLADCHSKGTDSQAIAGWNGPGPFKIVNNHLEGAGENVMFGGSDPSIANLIPSDIEFRRNHVVKPLNWQGVWTIKNLFELKNARRVLVEGNVFENNWLDAQTGFAILMKSVNQDGAAPWSQTSDVTFQYNVVRRVGGAVSLAGRPESAPAVRMARVRIANNVFEQVGDASLGAAFGLGRLYQVQSSESVEIAHNTGLGTLHGLLLVGEPATGGFVMRDNVLEGGPGISSADGRGVGTQALDFHVPGWKVAGNVIGTTYAATAGSNMPTGNSYTTNGATAGAAATTTDGRPVGADRAAIDGKTSGVVIAP